MTIMLSPQALRAQADDYREQARRLCELDGIDDADLRADLDALEEDASRSEHLATIASYVSAQAQAIVHLGRIIEEQDAFLRMYSLALQIAHDRDGRRTTAAWPPPSHGSKPPCAPGPVRRRR
jgi:hypothetical protein